MKLTLAQLTHVMPLLADDKAQAYLGPLNDACAEYSINTRKRLAAFLGQIAHESMQLLHWRELWGPTEDQKRYEPPSKKATELGNTRRGDGFRYRGRGPIQLTGRANYATCGAALGVSLVGEPELLERPEVGFRSAGWYWRQRGLNELADRDMYFLITKRINGGTRGVVEREGFTRRALAILPETPPRSA